MDIDIAEFFTKVLRDIAEVDCFDEDDWWPLVRLEASDDRLHAPFGFLPPIWVPGRVPAGETEPGTRVARLCPAVIARQIAGRSENDREDYLSGMHLHLSLHVIHRDDPNIESLIDNLMWDNSPSTMRLVSDVQLGALSVSR